MNRIRTFGCSMTSYHNWQYLVKNHPWDGKTSDPDGDKKCLGNKDYPVEWIHDGIHLTDYSIAGWGNDIQHIQYANEVYYNNISKDDIIIWQLSSTNRIAIENEISGSTNDDIRVENIFSGEEFNLTLNNNIHNSYSTYSTLWQLNGVKRNNDKLLVIFGWDFIYPEEKKEIINFLKEHDIDYIEESIVNWTRRHKFFKKDKDKFHPPQEGYKSFTEGCLLPKLNKLKWLD